MKKIVYYIVVAIICIIGLPFSFFFKEKWNEFGRSVDRFFGVKSRHTKRWEKDLCKTCEHFWLDFPMPLDKHIAHCEVLDKKGGGLLDDVVEYPCLKCPFNSYLKKEEL